MNRAIQLFSSILLLFFLQTAAFAEQAKVTQTTGKPTPEFLFVLAAKDASISKNGNEYILRLQFPDKKLLYFSDRPYRMAGHLILNNFISEWFKGKESFKNRSKLNLVGAKLQPGLLANG